MDNQNLIFNICYVSHEDLKAKENSGLAEKFAVLSSPHSDKSLYVDNLVRAENSVVYAATLDNTVVGMTTLAFGGTHIDLLHGIVVPELRGRGINADMINYVEKHSLGFGTLRAFVGKNNSSSQRSLEKLGFEKGEMGRYLKKIDGTLACLTFDDAKPSQIIKQKSENIER